MSTPNDVQADARREVADYLAQMDRAGGGIYTPDFRDGFRHALAMLDAAHQPGEPTRVSPIVAEAAREALRRRRAEPDAGDVERIVSMLAAHQYLPNPKSLVGRCTGCDWQHFDSCEGDHRAHVADLLAARDAEVRRTAAKEALLEAADAIQALHPGETKNSVIFLRNRAREEGRA